MAQLFFPHDVAVDVHGNVYITDGDRIRKVGTNGVITTIAQIMAGQAFYGVAVDRIGNVYIPIVIFTKSSG